MMNTNSSNWFHMWWDIIYDEYQMAGNWFSMWRGYWVHKYLSVYTLSKKSQHGLDMSITCCVSSTVMLHMSLTWLCFYWIWFLETMKAICTHYMSLNKYDKMLITEIDANCNNSNGLGNSYNALCDKSSTLHLTCLLW